MICASLGLTDSAVYLKESLKYLKEKIVHVSISVECSTPRITPKIPDIRASLSKLLLIDENCIGITATTGEELTEFGRGNGINVFTCITVD